MARGQSHFIYKAQHEHPTSLYLMYLNSTQGGNQRLLVPKSACGPDHTSPPRELSEWP